MKHWAIILVALTASSGIGCTDSTNQNEKIDYINPIIGAVTYGEMTTDIHGFGKTFPGAATPFGLVQLSPDTRTGGDNGCGYSWNHRTIEGFSFTHMSGVGWNGDLGNFLVMPTVGEMHTNKGSDDHPESGYRSRFSHDTEVARVGYYKVRLDDYGIDAEMTAAPRAGILRFTYPESDCARIQIDLSRRVGGTSTEQYVKVEDAQTISGWMKCTADGGGWGNGDGFPDYTVYFYCQFSKPLEDYGVWTVPVPEGMIRKNAQVTGEEFQRLVSEAEVLEGITSYQGKHIGFYTNFSTDPDEVVFVKCGISFVDVEGARKNLEHDIPDWDFERVENNARRMWSEAFAPVTVSGGTERDKEIFYTSLYHTMIDPRCFSDVDGRYVGADRNVHCTEDFVYRTIFSG